MIERWRRPKRLDVEETVSRYRFGKWRPERWFLTHCFECGRLTRRWSNPCGGCKLSAWLDEVQS